MFRKLAWFLPLTLMAALLTVNPVALAAGHTPVDDLQIIASAQILPAGGSGQLQVFDHQGRELTHVHLLAFSVSNPKIINVKNETFTTRHPGQAIITAIYHSPHDLLIHRGSLEITVEPALPSPRPTVEDLVLRVSKPTVRPRETGRIDVFTQDGSRVTDSYNCAISSRDQGELFVKDNTYTGVAFGETTILAHYFDARDGKNHTGQIKITVAGSMEEAAGPHKSVFTLKSSTYIVDGQSRTANHAPYLQGEDTVYLPVRALAQALGLEASYNAAKKTTVLSNPDKNLSLDISAGHGYFFLGGVRYPRMQHPPHLLAGSMMVESQEIAAAFGYQVTYDAKAQNLTISR